MKPLPACQSVALAPSKKTNPRQVFRGSRADVDVRTPTGVNYIVDVTIVQVDAAAGPNPNDYEHTVGKATEAAFDEKVTQYCHERFRIPTASLRVGAFDMRLKETIVRESKSRVSVAIQCVRVVAAYRCTTSLRHWYGVPGSAATGGSP